MFQAISCAMLLFDDANQPPSLSNDCRSQWRCRRCRMPARCHLRPRLRFARRHFLHARRQDRPFLLNANGAAIAQFTSQTCVRNVADGRCQRRSVFAKGWIDQCVGSQKRVNPICQHDCQPYSNEVANRYLIRQAYILRSTQPNP